MHFSEVNMSTYREHRQGNSRPAPPYQKTHENPVQSYQHKSSGRSHPSSHNRSSDNRSGNRNLAKVKISNLSPAVDKDDVRFVFEEFGKVVNVEIHAGDLLINNIGYAIVEFDSLKSAENAVNAMNEGILDDRLITVEIIPLTDSTENEERTHKARNAQTMNFRDANNSRHGFQPQRHPKNFARGDF
ncbi:Serine/arginine-rich splicing factor 2 [Trichinella papuae]|uniref:Serine/arginine-rich splicing factor 2 n=1 Tax=Trichinella papuae TaxID=268474 RepID=A0A0V1N3F1_9BILA|nr:Serine/arginine-rich splicing factor 2 [Trichinella papuae]